jgi:hypothetical protein
VARDAAARNAVYACVERALHDNQAFHCEFPERASLPASVQLGPYGYRAGVLAGWFGSGDGRVHSVTVSPHQPTTSSVVFDRAQRYPLRAGDFVKPPAFQSFDDGARHRTTGKYDGLVIVETTIGDDGRVQDVRALKAIAGGATADAVELVRHIRFHPAKAFGYAVPVVHNVSIDARGGKLTLTHPPAP